MRALAALSLDAKVIGAVALGNWILLFANHTVVQVARDAPLWQLFPGLWAAAWMLTCGLLAAAYPLLDHRLGRRFGIAHRAIHLAAIILVFVVVPTIAAIVLRETGKPYTYVHDGAIMVEEAARKLLAGQDPYVADYLDTPLFYWPMINNPALYHLTYFPALFLTTLPFVAAFDHLGLFWDERYLYLPAFIATLIVARYVAKPITARAGDAGQTGASPARAVIPISMTALVALNPQLFPFVVEGRNDFFVLFFLFLGIALLGRDRRTLGFTALAIAAASKLHAGPLIPFALAYLVWSDRARPAGERAVRLVRAVLPGAVVMAAVFLPFVVDNVGAFWDDIVAYNAGGAAWSYPISGMGFAAILRALGVISYPQQDFPFAALQVAAALPLAAWSLQRLRTDPSIATLLEGYSVTLLAFLFFGRYFHGNHLGFIAAVATPVPFLRPGLLADAVTFVRARRPTAVRAPATAVIAPVTITSDTEPPIA